MVVLVDRLVPKSEIINIAGPEHLLRCRSACGTSAPVIDEAVGRESAGKAVTLRCLPGLCIRLLRKRGYPMFNEEQLVAAAEAAAGAPLLAKVEARRTVPGEIFPLRGLLGATSAALVYVVDDFPRAGPVRVWQTRDITRCAQQVEFFSVNLTLETKDGPVRFCDLRPEEVASLLAACGLTPARETPTEAAPTPAATTLPPATQEPAPAAVRISHEPAPSAEVVVAEPASAPAAAASPKDKALDKEAKLQDPTSPFLGLGLLALIGAGIALPWYLASHLGGFSFLGLAVGPAIDAVGSMKTLFWVGLVIAAVCTTIGAPAASLGARPTVFGTTLPMAFVLIWGLIAQVEALPFHIGVKAATASELIARLRVAETVPFAVVAIGAYVYLLPLLGVWMRALSITPHGHAVGEDKLVAGPDAARPALLMAMTATIIPAASLFFARRSEHAVPCTLIALAFILPAALMAWQGSRLDPRAKWNIGGAPAAFVLQAAVVYALYWVAVRQLGILAQVDAVAALPNAALATSGALARLGMGLRALDLNLALGCGGACLGVAIAANVGQRALVAVEPGQRASGTGWTLAIIMLLVVAVVAFMSWNTSDRRLDELLRHIQKAAAAGS